MIIDIFLVAVGSVGVVGAVAITSYEFGRRSGGPFRLYGRQPVALVQLDPAMSEAEMLRFLEQAADQVRLTTLAKANCGKDERTND